MGAVRDGVGEAADSSGGAVWEMGAGAAGAAGGVVASGDSSVWGSDAGGMGAVGGVAGGGVAPFLELTADLRTKPAIVPINPATALRSTEPARPRMITVHKIRERR